MVTPREFSVARPVTPNVVPIVHAFVTPREFSVAAPEVDKVLGEVAAETSRDVAVAAPRPPKTSVVVGTPCMVVSPQARGVTGTKYWLASKLRLVASMESLVESADRVNGGVTENFGANVFAAMPSVVPVTVRGAATLKLNAPAVVRASGWAAVKGVLSGEDCFAYLAL